MTGSFFDTAERGALTLTLSHNDPFNAEYFTQDGVLLYRVCTRKRRVRTSGTESSSGIASGLGMSLGILDGEVTTVQRLRTDPSSASTSASGSRRSSALDNGDETKAVRTGSPSMGSSRSSPRSSVHRHRRCTPHRRTKSSSALSLSTPLDTIDEVAKDTDEDGTTTPVDGGGSMEVDAAERSDSPSIGPGAEDSEHNEPTRNSQVDDDGGMIFVATIERRPLSLSPIRLRFHGNEGAAGKFLQRERPFSSTRCFVSLTGDLLKWQLSTPVPKLYNSNKTRIAKYCAPFLPSKGMLSSSTAELEITQGIDSDRALDEILVTLLLTFIL